MPKKISKKKAQANRVSLVKKGIEDEEYPMEDWKYDVANGDTKLGYIDWVLHNIESHEGDQP
jgi:hypothetical protein